MAKTQHLCALSALLIGISGALAAQTLETLLAPIPGSFACWQRSYSDTHLAAHPRQKVIRMHFGMSYYEMDHHEAGKGEHAFSVDVETRERRGSAGGLCHTNAQGRVICAVECDGGILSVRNSGSEGSVLVGLDWGRLSLSECGSETSFELSAEPDDKLFLLHPVACPDDDATDGE